MAKKKTTKRTRRKVVTKKKVKRSTRKKKAPRKRTRRKVARKTATRRKARKKAARKKKRRPRRSALASASTAELRAEVRRREATLARLQHRRDRVADTLASLDDEIATITGRGRGRPVRRPTRPRVRGKKMSLVEALQQALKNKTLSVTEAEDAVQRLGYRSRSANFRVIVNQALLANPKIFRKVSRGQYTVRTGRK